MCKYLAARAYFLVQRLHICAAQTLKCAVTCAVKKLVNVRAVTCAAETLLIFCHYIVQMKSIFILKDVVLLDFFHTY